MITFLDIMLAPGNGRTGQHLVTLDRMGLRFYSNDRGAIPWAGDADGLALEAHQATIINHVMEAFV